MPPGSAASEEMYKASQGQPQEGEPHAGDNGGQQQGKTPGDGEVTDVDFEEVKN